LLIIAGVLIGSIVINKIGLEFQSKNQRIKESEKQKQELIDQNGLLEETRLKLENEKKNLESQLQARLLQKQQQVRIASVTTTPKTEAEAKLFIYQKESGNRTNAINKSSGACGLGQALPCSKLGCSLDDYSCQDKWFSNYAIRRYGSWVGAYQFWLTHRWW
jgi:hypothetical protein